MKICILGDTGLLGQALARELAPGYDVLGISSTRATPPRRYRRVVCDVLRDEKRLFRTLRSFNAELYFNCIGLVDVAGCERSPKLARRLNSEFPDKVARFARQNGARLVHISTDQVFDGRKRSPYRENDTPRPLNVYGATKLAGERAVLLHGAGALVVRTNIVGFRGLRNKPTFAEWLCRSLRDRSHMILADDFITSSIHVGALAPLLERAAQLNISGLYHIATGDSLSKFAFGRRLARNLRLDFSATRRGRLSDLNLRPERPAYLALSVDKARRVLGRLPRTNDTVRRLAVDYRSHTGGRS